MGCNSSKIQISPIVQDCPICYKTIENKIITPCNHEFCYSCLSKWITTLKNNRYKSIIEKRIVITCPVCRQSIENVRIQRFRKSKLRIMVKIKA